MEVIATQEVFWRIKGLYTLISGGSRVSATNVETLDPPKMSAYTSSSKFAMCRGGTFNVHGQLTVY